jgi:serine/threonine protein kinase
MKTCPVCDTDYPDQHTNCPTDGAVLIVSHELAEGSLVRGKYRIIRKLGQGGMGVVYLAEDILLGVRVALKFLASELSKDPRFIKRFRNEARAAYQLRHPNIVEVTALDQAEDGSLFIAMEYVDGVPLFVYHGDPEFADIPHPVERALGIAREIASGLAAAHAQGTVHRDIKPENIRLTRGKDGQEHAKILDFGIAAMAESATRVSMTHGILLTPEYAAPEQWLEMPAAEIDGRTDTYALGCVLYWMLTRHAPFHAHNTAGWMMQHLEEAPKPPSQLRPDLADWVGLDELVLRMLAKKREDRPRDAELLSLLDAVHYAPGEKRRQTVVEIAPKRQETVVEVAKARPETIWETPTLAPPPTPELSVRPAIPVVEKNESRAAVQVSKEQKPVRKHKRRKVVLIVAVVVCILIVSAIYYVSVVVYPFSSLNPSRIEADEKAVIQSMRAIHEAEAKYQAMYPDRGYACSLAKLGGYRILGRPTADAAQLLPNDLAAGASKGYIFNTACMYNGYEEGRVAGYNLYAYPRIVGQTGNRGFCGNWLSDDITVDPKVNPARGAQCSQRLK